MHSWTRKHKSNSRLKTNLKLWQEPYPYKVPLFVGNKAKGRISKRVFQENKAHQIFQKTNISYSLIRTRAYQGVRNVRFPENLTRFLSLKHPFWDSPFCLITDAFSYDQQQAKKILLYKNKARSNMKMLKQQTHLEYTAIFTKNSYCYSYTHWKKLLYCLATLLKAHFFCIYTGILLSLLLIFAPKSILVVP